MLEAFPPEGLALEQMHSHVKHPRTAILMAHARGVIMLAAAQRSVAVFGYAASRIKNRTNYVPTRLRSGSLSRHALQHSALRSEREQHVSRGFSETRVTRDDEQSSVRRHVRR